MPKSLRADAARNRDRLLSAAEAVFAERGLDAPLEEIARRAGVSIGTLYNHFPGRDDLMARVFAGRLATALDRVTTDALATDDPWDGFVSYVTGLLDLHASDQGLSDALAQRRPVPADIVATCARSAGQASEIVARAHESGRLRPDFTDADLGGLVLSFSHVIRETRADNPGVWRRLLAFHLDGLRAEAAHPIDVPPRDDDAITRWARGA